LNPAALLREIRNRPDKFGRVAGVPVDAQVEYHPDERRIDHVWITIEIAEIGRFRIALNTLSRRNRDAGFDERVRVGIVASHYEQLPPGGIFDCNRFAYAEIEKEHNVFYEFRDKAEMQSLLIERAQTAAFVEAWGDLYARNHPGIHQVHSRRASCAVSEDLIGRDGAVKFYFTAENRAEMLLFKFCGQP
jgi:hypothetical protein